MIRIHFKKSQIIFAYIKYRYIHYYSSYHLTIIRQKIINDNISTYILIVILNLDIFNTFLLSFVITIESIV